ncbi:uncharacterized protein K02A2.6-like [Ylistrum balloti]|uniref:uncharacterized protein K02A2.6-like n=1 Tax=Ylistrum balloti TaxID=509963 RepID=UPI002905AB30|nr:uncharacterized protein K02A2.6-like [Ylistrum balloti]
MAPKRLQDIMVRMMRYDIEFTFVKGSSLILADTLNRAYLEKESRLEERSRILSVNIFGDIPDAQLDEIREATSKDTGLQSVIRLVLDGWPDDKNEVPSGALPYLDFRDVISYSDGILVKGEAIVIPSKLRSAMKDRRHSAHLGHDSMLRKARGTIFWPGMNSDMRQLVNTCELCQETKPRNAPEPLQHHADGDVPWTKVGLDLFEIQGSQYLITVDYLTNFIEVDHLPTTTTARVVSILKKHLARYCIPRVIISDGGPQFSSNGFATFAKSWGITHFMSSPMRPQSKGKGESAVKKMKRGRKEGILMRQYLSRETLPVKAQISALHK